MNKFQDTSEKKQFSPRHGQLTLKSSLCITRIGWNYSSQQHTMAKGKKRSVEDSLSGTTPMKSKSKKEDDKPIEKEATIPDTPIKPTTNTTSGAESKRKTSPTKTNETGKDKPTNSREVRTKQAPQRKPTLATDVYVTRKASFNSMLKRCERLLRDPNNAQDRRSTGLGKREKAEMRKEKERLLLEGQGTSSTSGVDPTEKPTLTIHGLGAAIKMAIELANTVQRRHPGVAIIKTTTETVPLVDLVHKTAPTLDELENESESTNIDLDLDLDNDTEIQKRFNSAIHIAFYRIKQA